MLRRIGLGTAQFGTHYGVSNDKGKPDEDEVARILAAAEAAGLGYIDTAPGYFDAEVLVGRHLSRSHAVHIVTKTPPIQAPAIKAEHKQEVLDALRRSLERLKIERVYGLLVHHASDLAKDGWEWLVEAMEEARAEGLADRLGVSVYDRDQLELAATRLPIGVAQIPCNVLDSRLMKSGIVHRLRANGTEIHARSVFLQGLLLMKPSQLPHFFLPLRERLSHLHASWTAAGLTPAAACLWHVLQSENIDVAVVGFNSLAEFSELDVALNAAAIDAQFEMPAVEPQYLDPSRWPPFR